MPLRIYSLTLVVLQRSFWDTYILMWSIRSEYMSSVCMWSDSTSDRYFMALYRKLLDPALRSSNKIAMFLNLLFKSLKSDQMERRVQVIVIQSSVLWLLPALSILALWPLKYALDTQWNVLQLVVSLPYVTTRNRHITNTVTLRSLLGPVCIRTLTVRVKAYDHWGKESLKHMIYLLV